MRLLHLRVILLNCMNIFSWVEYSHLSTSDVERCKAVVNVWRRDRLRKLVDSERFHLTLCDHLVDLLFAYFTLVHWIFSPPWHRCPSQLNSSLPVL